MYTVPYVLYSVYTVAYIPYSVYTVAYILYSVHTILWLYCDELYLQGLVKGHSWI